MGEGEHNIIGVAEDGGDEGIRVQLRNADGIVVGSIRLYAEGSSDGGVCAQFELRFANQPGFVVTPGSGVDASGYADRRPGVVVEVVTGQSVTDSVRLSIDISGETSGASDSLWSDKAIAEISGNPWQILRVMRAGCQDHSGSDHSVHRVA